MMDQLSYFPFQPVLHIPHPTSASEPMNLILSELFQDSFPFFLKTISSYQQSTSIQGKLIRIYMNLLTIINMTDWLEWSRIDPIYSHIPGMPFYHRVVCAIVINDNTELLLEHDKHKTETMCSTPNNITLTTNRANTTVAIECFT